MSCDRIEEIKLATNQDDVMQEAIRCTIEGWPQHPKDVPRRMARVYAERSHLSVTGRPYSMTVELCSLNHYVQRS